ncbi:MAG: 16S rRNA processing protein RimM [Deltaproteobacteria bacterium]|nr:16S rRNA processing protein RimM [Deltaproteobacteria bacterium]
MGRVTGPHGIHGKVRVAMYSGDAGGMLGIRRVWLSGGPAGSPDGREFEVVEAQRAGGCAVFSLKGVLTPEAARDLAGARVSVLRDDLPDLADGEFYWADAVGCAVVNEAGESLGEVTGVAPGSAHDWLVVRRNGEETYLPVVEAFVRSVDIPAKRIVASPPEGW